LVQGEDKGHTFSADGKVEGRYYVIVVFQSKVAIGQACDRASVFVSYSNWKKQEISGDPHHVLIRGGALCGLRRRKTEGDTDQKTGEEQ